MNFDDFEIELEYEHTKRYQFGVMPTEDSEPIVLGEAIFNAENPEDFTNPEAIKFFMDATREFVASMIFVTPIKEDGE